MFKRENNWQFEFVEVKLVVESKTNVTKISTNGW